MHSSDRVIRDRARITSALRRRSPPTWNGLSRSTDLRYIQVHITYMQGAIIFSAGTTDRLEFNLQLQFQLPIILTSKSNRDKN